MKLLKAIRAATTVKQDSAELIEEASVALMSEFIRLNDISTDDIVSVFFTITSDLRSLNPATAVRQNLQWNDVAMICAQEAFIENGLNFCIRALIHVHISSEKRIQHVYLNGASVLRSDWSKTNFLI